MRLLGKNKKALSPLIATILLVVFALVIGTAVMNWGKGYIQEKEKSGEKGTMPESSCVIEKSKINTPLKELQAQYILGIINEQDYLLKEKEFLNKSK